MVNPSDSSLVPGNCSLFVPTFLIVPLIWKAVPMNFHPQRLPYR